MHRVFFVIGALIAMMSLAAGWVVQPAVSFTPITAPSVDAKRLEAHVKRLSVNLHPRSFDRKHNLDAAADYIAGEWVNAGARVSFQTFEVSGEKFRNVVARFGPIDGALTIIGAHYDSHGNARGDPEHTEGHTPGADDNASGVAGLIELAALYAKHPPETPVELVAYALEEPPHFRTHHMGSAHHARAARASKREIALMISLEMIGTFLDIPDSQSFPLPGMNLLYPTTGNFIAVVGSFLDSKSTRRVKSAMRSVSELPVHSINAPRFVTGVDFSDHLNYWNEGIPALMITDTAFLRNEHYHLPEDTYEKLDYARMANVVQGVWAITAR